MKLNKLKKITLLILSCLLLFAFSVSAQVKPEKKTTTEKKPVSKTTKTDSKKEVKEEKKSPTTTAESKSDKAVKEDKESVDETAESNSVKEVKIDRTPMNDFTDSVVTQWSSKKLDVLKPFSVEMNVVLDSEGKFNRDYTKYLKAEGDKELVKVAKSGIQAASDSGYFMYIKNFGISNFKMTFAQDKDAIWAYIDAKAESVKQAKAIEKEYGAIIGKIKSETKDITEKFILEQFTATRKESQLTLKFKLPNIVVRQVLDYELRKASDKKITGN